MKSSLSRLRRFALHKNDAKDKFDFSHSAQVDELAQSAQVDELAQAAQEMQDMRNCYDSLLSAAAATANSAYEFSESLRELGSCLMEKTSLHDDEESSKVLSMLGNAQFELQKLVDSYRSHIFVTITNPSESLLNDLRTVEDMKRQCDAKRNVYEYMMEQQKEKGRSKSGRGESFTLQQLQTAHEEYEEEATLCVFRVKSLKQGQYRSLLTQAARHHAAQLNFFRKGLKSLEAVDTHLKLVAERQHIDYQFCGLEDDEGEDGEDGYYTNEEGELSFDYRRNKQGLDVSASRNSMEADEVGVSFPQSSLVENAEVNLDKNPGDHQASSREPRVSSYSAPLFAEKKIDQAEKIIQMQQPSTRKLNTYVLPTPIDANVRIPSRTSVPQPRPTNPSGRTYNLSHSSPLEQKKQEKDYGDSHLPELSVLKAQSVLKVSSRSNMSTQLPPPLAEGFSHLQIDTFNSSDTKKSKRQSFSGPLASKPSSTKPVSSSSGPITSTELPQLVSGVLSRSPVAQPSTSPRISPSASPPPVSSPRISELHELPRPPSGLGGKPAKSSGIVGHSAPLMLRNQEHSATNKIPSVTSNVASPLPLPPLMIVSRSFSIPSSTQRSRALHVSKLLEPPRVAEKTGDVSSPPLIPISLVNVKPISAVSPHSGQIRVGKNDPPPSGKSLPQNEWPH